MTDMRAAAGVRGYLGMRFASGSFTMTVLPAGTYSYAVEYTDGVQEFGEFTVEDIASRTPIITAEGVTGDWSLIARVKYAPGTTMGQMFNMEKDIIKHAIDGEIVSGEDEDGFIYEPASFEECRKAILAAFDNAVYHCLEANAFGRVYDYLLEKNGVTYTLQEILLSKAIEDSRFNDYQYEPPEEGE